MVNKSYLLIVGLVLGLGCSDTKNSIGDDVDTSASGDSTQDDDSAADGSDSDSDSDVEDDKESASDDEDDAQDDVDTVQGQESDQDESEEASTEDEDENSGTVESDEEQPSESNEESGGSDDDDISTSDDDSDDITTADPETDDSEESASEAATDEESSNDTEGETQEPGDCIAPCEMEKWDSCSSPQVRITEVDVGVTVVNNDSETELMPLVLAPVPSGGSRLAWMSDDGKVYVAGLDCDDQIVGDLMMFDAHDFQDIAADDDGGGDHAHPGCHRGRHPQLRKSE